MHESPNPITGGISKELPYHRQSHLSTRIEMGILLDKNQWLTVQKQYSLTQREREIAELICQGLRNEHIAGHLRITSGTVKTHIRNIYRKIHVKNKIGMLLKFVVASRELSTQYDGAILSPVID